MSSRIAVSLQVHHSTETAVTEVLVDILFAMDAGDLSVLTLLDLSAAFDTVDHSTILARLKTSCGVLRAPYSADSPPTLTVVVSMSEAAG